MLRYSSRYSLAALFFVIVIINITLFLSACTLEPRYEQPAAPVAAHYPTDHSDHPTRNATDKAATLQPSISIPASEMGWRQFFGDAHLRKLVEIEF